MAKSLIIDQIEVTQNGTVQVFINKISSDGDFIGNRVKRLPPASDINAEIAEINAYMATENFSAISAADVIKLTAICNAAWTESVIAAYQAAQAAAEAMRQTA